MRTLLIDDFRTIEADREGLQALQEGGWDLLLLDHDLGDPDPRHTGYDLLSWLERNPQFLPKRIELVTANPVGREKMKMVIEKLYK
jgi:hypothetical protein